MPLPLALAVPAAAAAAAYINARAGIWYDAHLAQAALPAALAAAWRERTDRLNPFYVLERHARSTASASRTFLIFESKRYTYAEVYDLALRHGTWLKEHHGVKSKDIVAIDYHNSDTFVFLWFGLWSIGAKPAFINYNLTDKPLIHCIKTATSSLVLVDPNVADNITDEVRSSLGESVKFVILSPQMHSEIQATEPRRAPDAERSEDKFQNLAILIYTSGTTGLPKAAIVSFMKCILGGIVSSRFIGNTSKDIFYTSMPLYHSTATLLGFLNTLEAGSCICIGRKFSTHKFWSEVRESRATIIQYVGETCRYLLSAPPQRDPKTGEDLDKKHHVRAAFGNGLRPDVWNDFKERFGIQTIGEFYASTEGNLATWNLSSNDFARGAIGRNGWVYNVIMGMNLAAMELDDEQNPVRDPSTGFCRPAAPGEPGEMVFRVGADDRRFQGYYGNKSATQSKVMRDVFRKGDGWFRTGDIIRWDSDGRVFFSDRIGDTFRWKSENVSTQEVSEAVGTYPAVREANVYGVQLPNHDGRAGCAAVVFENKTEGAAEDKDETLGGKPNEHMLRGLAQHVRKQLPRYALPIFLRVMPRMGMQMTGTQKLQKNTLQAEGVHLAEGAEGEVYWLRDDTYVRFTERDWDELNGGRVKL